MSRTRMKNVHLAAELVSAIFRPAEIAILSEPAGVAIPFARPVIAIKSKVIIPVTSTGAKCMRINRCRRNSLQSHKSAAFLRGKASRSSSTAVGRRVQRRGQYFAIDDLCPHMGASLGAGEVHDGAVLCPWHAWRFGLCDGAWRDNPKLKVDRFDTRVVGRIFKSASRRRRRRRRQFEVLNG